MPESQLEIICPFCKRDNRCMAGKRSGCWCEAVEIPSSLLELLPEQSRDKFCVCQSCVDSFKADVGLFKTNLHRPLNLDR